MPPGNSVAASPSAETISLDEPRDTELPDPPLYPGPTALPFYAGLTPAASNPLFDLLRTKWLRQLIRPLVYESLIELYYQESMAMAMYTPFYMHALLACCAAEYPVNDTNVNAREQFSRLSRKHYIHAITGLREALRADVANMNREGIIRTVLILCIFEVRSILSHIANRTLLTQASNREPNLGHPVELAPIYPDSLS